MDMRSDMQVHLGVMTFLSFHWVPRLPRRRRRLRLTPLTLSKSKVDWYLSEVMAWQRSVLGRGTTGLGQYFICEESSSVDEALHLGSCTRGGTPRSRWSSFVNCTRPGVPSRKPKRTYRRTAKNYGGAELFCLHSLSLLGPVFIKLRVHCFAIENGKLWAFSASRGHCSTHSNWLFSLLS